MRCLKLVIGIVVAVVLAGCHDAPDFKDDNRGNFEALFSAIDEHYCFFEEKGIDWDSVGAAYRAEISSETDAYELFDICARMLDELKDGHVNLSAPFNTSYYRKWWSDYPQDFNLRTLEQYYLGFDWESSGGLIYKQIGEQTGYIYIPSFASAISGTKLDYALYRFKDCKALVIDVRDNGGGMLTNVKTLVGRFISKETSGGFISHKTGPGHNDFSKPYPISYEPADKGVKWLRPVIVLTNRSTFSAANDFVAAMKGLDGVTIVGAKTGGGGGLPFTSEMPNGWTVRFSACPITDRYGNSTESGIEPDSGCEVHASAEELASGRDAIMDFAIALSEQRSERMCRR